MGSRSLWPQKIINEYQPNKIIHSRQNAPSVFDMNASIYIWKRNILFKKNYLFRKKSGIYLMPYKRSIDIDNKDDLNLVKYFKKIND